MLARRYGLSFWVTLVVLVATFATEPRATTRLAADALQAVGEFGGTLVVELLSDGSGEALVIEDGGGR